MRNLHFLRRGLTGGPDEIGEGKRRKKKERRVSGIGEGKRRRPFFSGQSSNGAVALEKKNVGGGIGVAREKSSVPLAILTRKSRVGPSSRERVWGGDKKKKARRELRSGLRQ